MDMNQANEIREILLRQTSLSLIQERTKERARKIALNRLERDSEDVNVLPAMRYDPSGVRCSAVGSHPWSSGIYGSHA